MALAFLLMLGSLLAVASAAPTAAQGAAPETAAAVPETAVMYFVFDLDRDSNQWQQAQALLAHVGLPNALAEWERGLVTEIGPGSGVTDADVGALLGGEIALVVTEPAVARFMDMAMEDMAIGAGTGATPEPVASPVPQAGNGVAGILLPGDPDAAWAYVERELADLAQSTGVQVEQSTDQDVTLLTVAGDDPTSGAAVARVDDYILVAQFPVDLEPLIDAATGDAPSLAEFAPMAEVSAQLAAESLMFGFINGEALVAAVGPELFDSLQSMAPQAQLPAAYDFYTGMVLWADEPGFRLDTIAMPPAGGSLADLVPVDAEVTWDERVSADSLFFVGGSFPEGTWTGAALSMAQSINQEFGQGTDTEPPVSFEEMFSPEYVEEQFAEAERILGFDLRAGLFDQLVGQFAIAVSAPNLMTGGFDISALLAAEVQDAATVADSIQRLVRLAEASDEAPTLTTRTVDGDTIYVLQDPDAPEFPSVEFGVVDQALLAGIGAGVDDFLAGPASSLADDEQYQRVLATLPADPYQVVYVNLAQIVPLAMMAGEMTGAMGDAGFLDADPACAAFSTQGAAQETFDADPVANSNLDQDRDGVACDDFFMAATPVTMEATPVAAGGPEAITAFAMVAYARDGMMGTSAILYIDDSGN